MHVQADCSVAPTPDSVFDVSKSLYLARKAYSYKKDSADCNVIISNSCAAQKPECEVTEVYAFESQNLRYIHQR